MRNSILSACAALVASALLACSSSPMRIEAEIEPPIVPEFSPAIVIPANELPAHSVSGEILIQVGQSSRTFNLSRDVKTGAWRAPLNSEDLNLFLGGSQDRTVRATVGTRLMNSKGFTDYYWRDLEIRFRRPGLAAAQSK